VFNTFKCKILLTRLETTLISVLVSAVSAHSALAQPAIEPAKAAVLERDDLLIRLSKDGGCIEDLQLKGFKEKLNGIENARVTAGHFPCRGLGLKISDQDLRSQPAETTVNGAGSVTVIQKTQNLEISKSLQLREPFTGELSIVLKNTGTTPFSGSLAVDLGAVSELRDAGSLFGHQTLEYREAVYLNGEKLTRVTLPFENEPKREVLSESLAVKPEWVAANSLYFVLALLPKSQDVFDIKVLRTGYNSAVNRTSVPDLTLYEFWLSTTVNDLAPAASKTITFDLFAGPKSKSALNSAFSSKNLSKNIDFGFFSVVAWPLFYVLKWFEMLTRNWGVAIILLTLVLKIVLYPLTEKAFVAGKKMQALQPELNALKEKFKDDKQAQQKEMMSMMAQRGVNPMSGCLPILPQLPIFFGLNAVLMHTFELRHAPFAFWLKDLTARDPLYITPVIMAVLMYVQQKLTPAPASMDPAQQKMMQFLPLIFAVFMLTYPSGLVVYIITNTVLSLIQQKYMMRKYADL
jgi:YidC/Oxa1 family membrane protein insertase